MSVARINYVKHARQRMPLREHIFAYWDHAECHFEALWEIEGRPHADDPSVRG